MFIELHYIVQTNAVEFNSLKTSKRCHQIDESSGSEPSTSSPINSRAGWYTKNNWSTERTKVIYLLLGSSISYNQQPAYKKRLFTLCFKYRCSLSWIERW